MPPAAPIAARIPPPVRGALWIVVSTFCFTVMWSLVRYASAAMPALEISFFRFVFGLVFMLPLLARAGRVALRTRRLGHHLLNAFAQAAATACSFLGLAHIPIAEVTALTFTAPLFVTAGAALVLGEAVGLRRWAATLVGFAGALVILRPGVQAVAPAAIVVLVGSGFIAAGILVTRSLARTESPDAIVAYLTVGMALMSLPPALAVWTPPTVEALLLTAAMGLVGTIGLSAVARAYRAAEASAMMPYRYSALLFAALFGYALFGERPDAWTWAGAGVIIGASLYSARHEARLAKTARTASTVADRGRQR